MKESHLHLCLEEPVIFERGSKGRRGVVFEEEKKLPPAPRGIPVKFLRRSPPVLPELTEGEAVRHFTRLSSWNFSVDAGFYPLGSCTMKYNPRMNEKAARLPGFAGIHPYGPIDMVQGALELMHSLERWLSSICGFEAFSLQPAAGAHGELTSILIIRKYLESTGNPRKKILIPDTAHGTNFAPCFLFWSISSASSLPPRTNSRAMKGAPVAGLKPKSMSVTMLGW